jgi:RecA-family ATPase
MEIIPGVLRQGYIGILNSTSKAYKSWNLLALSIAAAEGKSWLGFPKCNPVKTLYVNLELAEEEFKLRIDKVASAMGTTRQALQGHCDFLNLKGHPTDLDSVLTRWVVVRRGGGAKLNQENPAAQNRRSLSRQRVGHVL